MSDEAVSNSKPELKYMLMTQFGHEDLLLELDEEQIFIYVRVCQNRKAKAILINAFLNEVIFKLVNKISKYFTMRPNKIDKF